jgi:arylsulfatase A
VFEGGVRVPAIVRWPALLGREERIIDAPAHSTDWVPTILEAASISPNALPVGDEPPLDGLSLVPLLTNEKPTSHRILPWQWNRYRPMPRCNAALRRREWKLVWPPLEGALTALPEDSAADRMLDNLENSRTFQKYSEDVQRTVATPDRPMLFNLADDPGESNDVASDHPTEVERMSRELDDWFAEVEVERAAAVGAGYCG